MKERVKKIFSHLDPQTDALVVANGLEPHIDHAFFYMFDAPSGLFEASYLIARADGTAHVLVSPLEEESARVATAADDSVTIDALPSDIRYGDRVEWLRGYLSRLLGDHPTAALNYRDLTHAYFLDITRALPNTRFVDASDAIKRARQVKDSAEVERLASAGAMASRVAENIPGLLRAGMTEVELAGEIDYAMSREGATGPSFDTIVAFGASTAEPHYKPDAHPLVPRDPIVCDFGASHRRYASDITRSFQFGRPSNDMRRIYETVREAQAAAFDAARPGALGKDVHIAAQAIIDATPWKGRFTHGVGHSVGLAVHDGFGMGPTTTEPLEEGMVLTIEPGIYVPGLGGVRIEDDILVTRGPPKFLTTAPREYVEVDA